MGLDMISCIRNTASCTVTVFSGIFAASAGALFAALYSQLALGLDPCVLCLYQRVPFWAAVVLSLLGLAMRANKKAVQIILGFCALLFLINAGIATYHTGVEKRWWTSAVEGCEVPNFAADPSLWEKILTAPAASCADIAWRDPVLGLTMANLNVVYCLALFAGCLIALQAARKQG
jgi:disulfide bond formation protein DsbB